MKLKKYTWSFVIVMLFVIIILQHVSGIWYNTEKMESTDSLLPLYIYGPQFLIVIGLLIWRYFIGERWAK